MVGNVSERDKKFVQSMLDSAVKKAKAQAYSSTDVDIKEVEQLTKGIQRKIQRGE